MCNAAKAMHSCIWQEKWTHNFFLKNWPKKGLYSGDSMVATRTHSRMGQYFFSYLLTLGVDLIEFLEIMAQMWHYVIFLSIKPTKVTSDFILN